MGNTKYLSCAETAKLVRQALKESFPAVKFAVRSSVYAGGASIHVTWTDGPTTEQVDAILGAFEAAYFDGMIDFKGSRSHRLDGEPVRFGADFVSGARNYSDALLERAIGEVAAGYGGCEAISVADYRNGHAWNWKNSGGCDLGRALQLWLSGKSDFVEGDAGMVAQPSATLARVQFAGDDGYGAGTVGNESNGFRGEQCYAAQHAARELQASLGSRVMQ